MVTGANLRHIYIYNNLLPNNFFEGEGEERERERERERDLLSIVILKKKSVHLKRQMSGLYS
jgi:hypothetical protein